MRESDAVRKQSWEDYGLGPHYYFVSGAFLDVPFNGRPRTTWHSLYARLLPELEQAIQPHMCEGWIGGLHPVPGRDGVARLIANDRLHIAHCHVCNLLTRPAALAVFASLATIADVVEPVPVVAGV